MLECLTLYSKYLLTDLKREIDSNAILLGGSHAPCSTMDDRADRKLIRKHWIEPPYIRQTSQTCTEHSNPNSRVSILLKSTWNILYNRCYDR